MSYDITLLGPVTKEPLHVEEPHFMRGGTFSPEGSTELSLNVTYNYSKHFYRLLDKEHGIRVIYGKTGAESIPLLRAAISQLADDPISADYWEPTEGNAKRALCCLLAMAQMRPDGVWSGD